MILTLVVEEELKEDDEGVPIDGPVFYEKVSFRLENVLLLMIY